MDLQCEIVKILEVLSEQFAPEEIIALRASEEFQNGIRELLDKNRTSGLTSDEQREWQQYEDLEHLVRLAKAKAHARVKGISQE